MLFFVLFYLLSLSLFSAPFLFAFDSGLRTTHWTLNFLSLSLSLDSFFAPITARPSADAVNLSYMKCQTNTRYFSGLTINSASHYRLVILFYLISSPPPFCFRFCFFLQLLLACIFSYQQATCRSWNGNLELVSVTVLVEWIYELHLWTWNKFISGSLFTPSLLLPSAIQTP